MKIFNWIMNILLIGTIGALIFWGIGSTAKADTLEIGDDPIVFHVEEKWEESVWIEIRVNGEIVFYSGGREMLKLTPDGKFYVAGRCTAKNIRVYLKFKEWLGVE